MLARASMALRTGGNVFLMLALALALLASTALAVAPAAAWAAPPATVAEDDEPKASELWDKGEEEFDIADDDKICEKVPKIDLTHLGNIGFFISRSFYTLCGSFVMGICDLIEEFMGLFQLGDLFSIDLTDPSLSGIYTIVSNVSGKVIQPIAGGFLGIALCMSLISFSKDASKQGKDGVDLFADILWLIVKFMLVQMLISNSMLLMHGIYDLVNFIGKAMTNANYGGLDASSIAEQASQFREAYARALMQVSYGGWGMAPLVVVVAAIALGVVVVSVLYIQFIAMFRLAEIFVRSAFVAIPLVMLTHQQTREDGIRYLKKYAGACTWALVIMFVVAMGAALMVMAGSLISVEENASFASVLVNSMPPVVACLVMFFLMRQAREFANDMLGSVI